MASLVSNVFARAALSRAAVTAVQNRLTLVGAMCAVPRSQAAVGVTTAAAATATGAAARSLVSHAGASMLARHQFESMYSRYPSSGFPSKAQCRLMSTAARDISGYNSRICAVLGAQWGDEGKGKLVDVLAKHYDIVARFNGGANAGHTLVVNNKKFAFHLLPCGMLYDNKINVIGNGVVVHIPTLIKELNALQAGGIKYDGKLLISDRAHLLFDFHQIIDGQQEKNLKEDNIGTTKRHWPLLLVQNHPQRCAGWGAAPL